MYQVLKCYERFYFNSTEEDRLMRAALFEECVNSRHVNSFGTKEAYVYEWYGSNPSG